MQVNCCEITQVASKCQMDFLDKALEKKFWNRRNEHPIEFDIHKIVYNQSQNIWDEL